MKNIHPVYHLETTHDSKELSKDPALAGETGVDSYLNSKKNVQRRKPAEVSTKGPTHALPSSRVRWTSCGDGRILCVERERKPKEMVGKKVAAKKKSIEAKGKQTETPCPSRLQSRWRRSLSEEQMKKSSSTVSKDEVKQRVGLVTRFEQSPKDPIDTRHSVRVQPIQVVCTFRNK
jgi:hypothetical protein